MPAEAVHAALKLITRLIKQCKLEAMLFQLSTLHTLLRIMETPAAKQPQHQDLLAACRFITRRFFEVAAHNHAAFVEVLVWKRASECELVSTNYEGRKIKGMPKMGEPAIEGLDDAELERAELERPALDPYDEAVGAADDADDGADDADDGADGGGAVSGARQPKPKRPAAPKKAKWSVQEDMQLSELYADYAEMDDWHHILAGFLAPRSALEILHRARKLKLATGGGGAADADVDDDNDDDDEGRDDDDAAGSLAPSLPPSLPPSEPPSLPPSEPPSLPPSLPPSDDEADEAVGRAHV